MHRSTRFLFAATLATSVVLTAATAESSWAKPSIAVLGLEIKDASGNIDEKTTGIATKLTDTLRRRARQPKGPYRLAPNSAKDLLEVKLLNGCDEGASCMAAIGKELKADRLLYGRVTKRKDGYQVSLDLLNVATASMERSTSELIPFGEANAAGLRTWGRSLYNRLTGVSEEGTIEIQANVGSGTVYVDGEVKTTLQGGKARITGLAEGPHTVGIESPGRDAYAAEVDVQAGKSTSLDVTLLSLTSGSGGGSGGDTSRPGGTSRALFWTSLVLTGAGAAAVTVTGLQVWGSLKDDKLAAIRTLGDRDTNPIQLPQQGACSAATMQDATDADVKAVIDACDAGNSRARLNNMLIGASVVSAIAASYFYYRGFISVGSGRSERRSSRVGKSKRATVRVVPQFGPGQVGAGMTIEF